MAFREKMAWISLLSTLGVWGIYFSRLARALATGSVGEDWFMGEFIGCVALIVVIQIVLAIFIAVLAPKEADAPMDEREQLIDLKASRVAYYLLSATVVTIALASPFVIAISMHDYAATSTVASTFLMANGVLAAVILAEVVRCSMLVVNYRRDAMA